MKKLLSVLLSVMLLVSAQITFAETEALSGKTAHEIVEQMGLGWNLGNTFDATGGNKNNVYSQETS